MRIVFIIVILIELKSVIDNVDPSLEWIRGSLSAAMIPDHPRRTRLTYSIKKSNDDKFRSCDDKQAGHIITSLTSPKGHGGHGGHEQEEDHPSFPCHHPRPSADSACTERFPGHASPVHHDVHRSSAGGQRPCATCCRHVFERNRACPRSGSENRWPSDRRAPAWQYTIRDILETHAGARLSL